MYIAQLLYPVRVLGPGDRIGIWFSGCQHGCPGCSNPELWTQQPKHQISACNFRTLLDSITSSREVHGFTITGGEPFLQPEALRDILPMLNAISKDILVYSGYTIEELKALGYQDILNSIAVLIDGRYQMERNNNAFLRGSDNQRIHILRTTLAEYYEHYLTTGTNAIQNFRTSTGFISLGIHRPQYKAELKEHLAAKGISSTKMINPDKQTS